MTDKREKFYITTPIYYPSGNPHIGHCYTTLCCDAVARYKRARGYDVLFLTGTDEHGQKIEDKAKAENIEPKEYVDRIVAKFRRLWDYMNISEHRFIRTTDDYHVKTVQWVFEELYKRGYIYKGKYTSNYCKPCESFWTDSQLIDGKCPDCGREVGLVSEEAYFFKLSAFSDRLQALLETPGFLEPRSRVTEMINNFIKPGLDDLCVSRTSFRWGIPVTFDEKHVVYVWVDALSNYISALGFKNDRYDDFDRFWPADYHVMAKEIVRFHSLVWPAILMALELPLPKHLYVHGWITFGDKKMGKSTGNVVDPFVLGDRYGVDAVRYIILREMPFSGDYGFSNELMLTRINTDLSNSLGNLVSRTTAMAVKYFGGIVPEETAETEFDGDLKAVAESVVKTSAEYLDCMHVADSMAEIFRLVDRANKYIDETQPWVLAKDEGKKPVLAGVICNLLEAIRITAVLLTPFIPDSMAEALNRIGAGDSLRTWKSIEAFGRLPAGTKVSEGAPLFPRIDIAKELEALAELTKPAVQKAEEKQEKPVCAFEDFTKLDIKVGEIMECKAVENSDKLLCSKIKVGEKVLTVVSGIRKYYSPEEMPGKKVSLIVNLKPRKIAGILSEGMVLCATGADGALSLIVPEDGNIPSGSEIG